MYFRSSAGIEALFALAFVFDKPIGVQEHQVAPREGKLGHGELRRLGTREEQTG
jgi:hypothetical protein